MKLSSSILRKAAEVQERIEQLEAELASLLKPQRSVIDARLYKALTLCLKASDSGRVKILSPQESLAQMDAAVAELERQPEAAHRVRESSVGA